MINLCLPPPSKFLTRSTLVSEHEFCSSSFSPSPSFKRGLSAEGLDNCLLNLIDGGQLPRAISILDQMVRHGSQPSPVTCSVLLKSCIRNRNFRLGRRVHSILTRSLLTLDSILYNSLISLYSKCGDVEQAKAVFQKMGNKRDLVSWSAMIACFVNNDREYDAIVTFIEMVEMGFDPNEYCFVTMIRACSNTQYFSVGEIVFAMLLKKGYLESNTRVGCALIDMFAKGNKELESALQLFDIMPEKSVVCWSLMISRCKQLGSPAVAAALFLEMVSRGLEPDGFTISAVVSVATELESLFLGKQLHSWTIKSGLTSDACVGCGLVDMYVKCTANGTMEDARNVFDRMQEHNVMSWTSIITGYVQNGGKDIEACKLFFKMLHSHVAPNQLTLAGFLKACGNIPDPRMIQQVYTHAVKGGFVSEDYVVNSLISALVQSSKMGDARKAFELQFKKKLVTEDSIMDGYSGTLSSKACIGISPKMLDKHMKIASFTLTNLISGAASIGALAKGEEIHARILKSGFEKDEYLCNALVSMYSKCGDINAAYNVFSEIVNPNVRSWTSMITGFAKHGHAVKALKIFHEMLKAHVRPNEVTYIAILSACSHVGLVSEGQAYLKSMYEEHGIVPRMEHYACMVDLYGRTGFLEKALDFINSMPLKPTAIVWRTFLGACKVHGDIELGRHAAKKLLAQDPYDEAAHVLLSNLFAASGQWNHAAEIRKNMKEQNLVKEAGCSWIEVESKFHRFYVGDTSHPRAKEIYEELDRLIERIKTLGYVPNTEFVLHELEEEEQKEKFLVQHSEKIAVTFGLISTSGTKPIRVFKNLRVCGDCHSAIKYISMATRREIILRDSNRFHHFSDGNCSCNDYW